jgi:hypothetical protein
VNREYFIKQLKNMPLETQAAPSFRKLIEQLEAPYVPPVGKVVRVRYSIFEIIDATFGNAWSLFKNIFRNYSLQVCAVCALIITVLVLFPPIVVYICTALNAVVMTVMSWFKIG